MSISDLAHEIRNKGTGYKPDRVDARDYMLRAAAPVEIVSKFYDDKMQPVRDQGNEGTCVGFALAGTKEFYDNLQRNTQADFSPRYIYYHCKLLDGIPNEEGTYPRVAMKVLRDKGVTFEHMWPYQPHQKVVPHPFDVLDQDASTQKIQTYARMYSVHDMLASLLLNGPFLIGVAVTEGFYTNEALQTGYVDPSYTKQLGGHAMCVVGYDAERRWFKVRNSWGVDYGDKGHNWLSYDWMTQYCFDAWSIVDDTSIDKGLVVVVPEPVEPQPEPITPPEPKPEPITPPVPEPEPKPEPEPVPQPDEPEPKDDDNFICEFLRKLCATFCS